MISLGAPFPLPLVGGPPTVLAAFELSFQRVLWIGTEPHSLPQASSFSWLDITEKLL